LLVRLEQPTKVELVEQVNLVQLFLEVVVVEVEELVLSVLPLTLRFQEQVDQVEQELAQASLVRR
jgi:hypothetical protein